MGYKVGDTVKVAAWVAMPNRTGDSRYQWQYGIIIGFGKNKDGKTLVNVEYGTQLYRKKAIQFVFEYMVKPLKVEPSGKEYQMFKELFNMSANSGMEVLK